MEKKQKQTQSPMELLLQMSFVEDTRSEADQMISLSGLLE